ncbi:hypothetical protein D3C75_757570 [compost metagenome]
MGRHQHKGYSAAGQLLITLRVQNITGVYDSIHLLLMKRVNVAQHPFLVAVCIADHQTVAQLNAGILHPPDHSGKVKVLNIRYKQSQCIGFLVNQPPGKSIRLILQLLNGFNYTAALALNYSMGCIHYT